MNASNTIESIVRDLAERAKELNCLYTVEELTGASELSLDEILRQVVQAIPEGWQYPTACCARITCDGTVYESPGFQTSPWVQQAAIRVQGEPVGSVEVYYKEPMPPADEGPFLAEERRLIDTIAERLGSLILHRRLLAAMRDWRSARQVVDQRPEAGWSVILDLLRRTDRKLLQRVARKMINHLCCSGVREADALLGRFRLAGPPDVTMDRNEPGRWEDLPAEDLLVDEAFRIAADHLSDDEILQCIHQWIKQDRASFLVNVLEDTRTSLSQVTDALRRYHHATRGELELSPAATMGIRVALIHRFLTGQLEFVNVAKHYVDLEDFHELAQRMIYPAEGRGKIGGKGAGLFLAHKILQRHGEPHGLADVRVPTTWYITSDGLYDFVYSNHLEDVLTHKYKSIEEIRQEYPDIIQLFKHSQFPPEILKGLAVALDELGERPLIVRSSSLLEDRFGAAFSGKYKSLFLPNQGGKQERLRALTDAIAEVYASTFNPDAIEYRAERNLLDFSEGMAILIQEVVGTRVGRYFLPAFAGVAFSHNEFRWSPRIRREDGLARLVPGLGTRAVDRVGDDFPILCAPGQPGLRVNTTPEEVVRYSPRYLDALNLATGRFETLDVATFLRECGPEMPGVEQLVSVLHDGHLQQPLLGQIDFERDDLVVTFEGLLTRTPFVRQIRGLLTLLQEKLGTPVDLEFASDGRELYLLQCRAQSSARHAAPAPIPRDLPRERVIFTANRHVSNGCIPQVTHIVYVDPEKYSRLDSLERLLAVGRAVGKLNKVLPKRQFILMGPGRWGSRGDIKLGVRVTYSDINNTALLVEIARRTGDYTPDLSFGTHFFQDLVEAGIRYLPLYPDEPGVVFNEPFLTRSGNILPDLAPEFRELSDTVYVIDVPRAGDGQVLRVLMNADLEEAVGVLGPPGAALPTADEPATQQEPQRGQDWRWRHRMAERIAAELDPQRFGVVAVYLIGSVKNATAGPASDIDLLIHFRGTPAQRAALELWLEGWSLCLSEMNYLRTGYKTAGLLDAHIITDDDIARGTSFAVKIDAVTDAARPLPIGQAVAPAPPTV
jgi:pyruvate,water dikinase